MQSRFDSETDILIGGDKIVPAENKIISPALSPPRQFDQFGKQLTAEQKRSTCQPKAIVPERLLCSAA